MVGVRVCLVGSGLRLPKTIHQPNRKSIDRFCKLAANKNTTVGELVFPRFTPPSTHSIEGAWEEQTVGKIPSGHEGQSPIHVIFNSGAYSENLSLLLVAIKHQVGSFNELSIEEAATILKTAAVLDRENPNLYIGANCSVVLEKILEESGLSHKLAQSVRKFFHMQIWDYSDKPINRLTSIPSNLKDLLRGSSYTYEWSKKLIKALKEENSNDSFLKNTPVLLTNHGIQFVFQNQTLSSLCEKDLKGFTNFIQSVIAGTNSHLKQMIETEIKEQKELGKGIDLQKIMNLGGQFTFFFKQKGPNLTFGIRPVFEEGGVLEAATSAMGESTILKRTNSPVESLLFHKLVTGLAEVIPVLKESLNGEINYDCIEDLIKAHPKVFYELIQLAQERIQKIMQSANKVNPELQKIKKQLRHYLFLAGSGLTRQT